MPLIFGIDIQGIVGATFGGGNLPDAVLVKKGPSVATPGDEATATQTTTEYPCTGLATAFTLTANNQTRIQKNDYQVMLILASVGPDILPAMGDTIRIAPPNKTAMVDGIVVKVLSVDPAAATATCHVRGVG